MLCYAMLCCAVLCCAVLYGVSLYFDLSTGDQMSDVCTMMPYHILCDGMGYDTLPRPALHALWLAAGALDALPCHAMPCHACYSTRTATSSGHMIPDHIILQYQIWICMLGSSDVPHTVYHMYVCLCTYICIYHRYVFPRRECREGALTHPLSDK
jgi:hypothetical protein